MSFEPLLGLRDRLLASGRFQEWARRFPLTRPIVRRRAGALFDLCAGFVYSQILAAFVRLRLYERLADGPRTAASLAHELDLSPEATRTLLRGAAALGLVEHRGGADSFGLGKHGAALRGNPGLIPMIEHHGLLYEDLRDPVSLLKSGEPAEHLGEYWAYARSSAPVGLSSQQVRPYTDLMSASQRLVSNDVLDAYPFDRHRSLLDIGGGDGTFAALAANRCPNLRITVFDLPAVVEQARARFAREQLGARCAAAAGDFFRDPLPLGADLVCLIRVLHDHDDLAAVRILRAARAVLPPAGRLLIAEPLAGDRPSGARADAYFGFYLLAMGSGRPRTREQLCALLESAGFTAPRRLATAVPLQVGVLVARARRDRAGHDKCVPVT